LGLVTEQEALHARLAVESYWVSTEPVTGVCCHTKNYADAQRELPHMGKRY